MNATVLDMEKFASVVDEYGVDLAAFTFCTQLGQVAMGKLLAMPGGGVPVSMLVDAYNIVASAYVEKMGWTDQQLIDCERALLLAATMEEKKIIVPIVH